MTDPKTACIQAMTKLGVSKIEADFSGGNDEGGYDEFRFYAGDEELGGEWEDFQTYDYVNGYTYGDGGKLIPRVAEGADPDRCAIAMWLNQVLDGEYGGFGGDFDVSGTVTVDAATRETTMSANETGWVERPVKTF